VPTARAQGEALTSREVSAERESARIAARQHGMIASAQLESAGFSRTQLTRRVDGGWLARRHVGVYLIGVFGGPFAAEAAALLACGPGAVLSHWAAAYVHGLVERRRRDVDVSIEGRLPGRRDGIRPHRAIAIPSCDVVVRHGLRVTTPARTLLDLAACTSGAELERLVEQAEVQGLVSAEDLARVATRAAGRRGVRRFREVVEYLDEPLFTRSEAERRLLALCRSAALPMPRTNVRRAGWEVDALWEEQRLIVEVDGYRYHRPQASFERDRRKDADLMLAGYRVLRLTWRRLTKHPAEVIALIGAALAPAQHELSMRR
jgi:very-short-patch-repair endonuclease